MFSKPLAVILLVLGCLTAAAGGAYFATRHNLSDAATVATRSAPPEAAVPASGSAAATAQPVAETEAAVSAAKAEAPASEAPKAEAPVPQRRSPAESAPAKPARTTTVARTVSPAPRRTTPINGGSAPVAQNEPAPVQTAAPTVTPASPQKPAEAAKPVEEPQPEPVRVPQFDEIILPASAVIGLQIESSTSTERARVEDRVDARVSRDVMAAGRVAIPAGSRVIGSVTTVDRGGKIKEQARLGIRFHTLVLADGSQVQLHTDPVYRLGDAPAASSTKKIGGAAIGGAILGAILGGGKGAAIGGATGAAGGTAAVMAGDRSAATLRQGEYLNVKLAAPATITVERRQ